MTEAPLHARLRFRFCVPERAERLRMLGGAGHLSLEGEEVGNDAVDVKVNDGLRAFPSTGQPQQRASGGAFVLPDGGKSLPLRR